jgi:hypothetical protein
VKAKSILTHSVLALFVVVAASAAALAQSKDFSRSLDFQAGGDLSVKTDKGSLRLSSWDRNQVEIKARIEAPENVSEDYARRAIEAVRIEVTGDGRSLAIRSVFDDVPYLDSSSRSRCLPHIHYEIRAPRRLNLSVDIDRSKLEITSFEGNVRLNTDRTPVSATDLTGELHLQMDRGDLIVSRFRGALDIETDRTGIDMRGVDINGDSRLEVERGEVALRLGESQRLSLAVDMNRRDSFQSDFGIDMRSMRGKSFEGTINGGGPRLTIRGERSTVRLKRD